jgi:hypothetical protein
VYDNSANGTRLEYQIRFQNTGTYPATFIDVLDTLENRLDPTTFEMIAASHDYTLSFPADNILKWHFDNINLPDSTSNEPESHGFVRFAINTKPNLALTDVISNRAGIYFDYNAPVLTNSATTSFYLGVLNPNEEKSLSVSVVPNPTDDMISVNYALSQTTDCRVMILNLQGEVLQTLSFGRQSEGNHSVSVHLEGLPTGMYVVRVMADGENGVKKIIKY